MALKRLDIGSARIGAAYLSNSLFISYIDVALLFLSLLSAIVVSIGLIGLLGPHAKLVSWIIKEVVVVYFDCLCLYVCIYNVIAIVVFKLEWIIFF
jgi:hypothetical protein